jgi:hypothetical protein
VKQLFFQGLDWLAHAIVWVFKWFSPIIVNVIELIAQVVVFITRAAIKLGMTIFDLLHTNDTPATTQ